MPRDLYPYDPEDRPPRRSRAAENYMRQLSDLKEQRQRLMADSELPVMLKTAVEIATAVQNGEVISDEDFEVLADIAALLNGVMPELAENLDRVEDLELALRDER